MDSREDMLDDDGENRIVRAFLSVFGGKAISVGRMRDNLDALGWQGCWPTWVEECRHDAHLTKAGAQLWLRHLFDLEREASAVPPPPGYGQFVPWTTETMRQYWTQLASPEGIPVIEGVRYIESPVLPLPDCAQALQELRAKIPKTADELIAFIGSHYSFCDFEKPDKEDWRFALSIHDLRSAFDWAGLYE